MFDPGGSASTTRTSPGRSWSGRCPTAPAPAAPAGSRPGPTGATARPGRTARPTYVPPAALERRVSATPYAELHCHSTFSFLDGASHPEELAEEAVRLGLEALAITDHDGFYGVVRFAEAARAVGMPTVFGAELSLGLTKPQNGMPDPEGSHLLVLARDPEGYARLASTISAAQLRGRREGQADLRRHRLGGGPRRPLAGAHRLPQGHRAPGPRAPRPGRRGAGARRADRHLRAPQRGGGAVRPRRPARLAPQRRPRPARDAGRRRRGRHHQRPLRHRRPAGRWPPPWRRCGPGAASTSSTRGCPPAPVPTCARATSRRAASPAGPARWSGPPSSGGRAPSTCSWWRRSSRRSRAPTASARWATSAASPPKARERRYGDVGHRAGAGRLPPDRARAGAHRAARVPRLLPRGVGHRRLLPPLEHLLPGPRQRRQQRGLLRARHHQRRRGEPRPALRAVPVARARRSARHRHRHRVGPPRGGDPVRLRQARPPPRRPGGQRDHLPRQVVDPRRRQGARLRVGPAGRLVEAGRRLGRRRRHRPAAGSRSGPSPRTCSRWPPSSSTRRGTSASTPAAW